MTRSPTAALRPANLVAIERLLRRSVPAARERGFTIARRVGYLDGTCCCALGAVVIAALPQGVAPSISTVTGPAIGDLLSAEMDWRLAFGRGFDGMARRDGDDEAAFALGERLGVELLGPAAGPLDQRAAPTGVHVQGRLAI